MFKWNQDWNLSFFSDYDSLIFFNTAKSLLQILEKTDEVKNETSNSQASPPS